jgi:PhnB protein
MGTTNCYQAVRHQVRPEEHPFWSVCRSSDRRFVVGTGQKNNLEFHMHPIPYLGFNGNCAEAMQFYATALGGEIVVMMNGADSPMADQIPKEFHDRILHARVALKDGGYLYGGDAPAHMPFQGVHGASVTLNFDTPDEAQEIFDKLCVGGKATMPMGPSFWATRFGMLTDRFGIPWIVNGGLLI